MSIKMKKCKRSKLNFEKSKKKRDVKKRSFRTFEKSIEKSKEIPSRQGVFGSKHSGIILKFVKSFKPT